MFVIPSSVLLKTPLNKFWTDPTGSASSQGCIGGQRNGRCRLGFVNRDQALWWTGPWHWWTGPWHWWTGPWRWTGPSRAWTWRNSASTLAWIGLRPSSCRCRSDAVVVARTTVVIARTTVVVARTTVVVARTPVVVARTPVVVARTTVVVVRTTVVVVQTTDIAVVHQTTSVQAVDWVGLVLRSSCLAGSSTSSMSSSDGLAMTPWALASIRGFTHLEGWYRN